jgi:hypothetical protein
MTQGIYKRAVELNLGEIELRLLCALIADPTGYIIEALRYSRTDWVDGITALHILVAEGFIRIDSDENGITYQILE